MEQIKAYLPVLTSNPYTTMLSNSLQREGVAVLELPLPMTVDWLIAHQGPGSVINATSITGSPGAGLLHHLCGSERRPYLSMPIQIRFAAMASLDPTDS